MSAGNLLKLNTFEPKTVMGFTSNWAGTVVNQSHTIVNNNTGHYILVTSLMIAANHRDSEPQHDFNISVENSAGTSGGFIAYKQRVWSDAGLSTFSGIGRSIITEEAPVLLDTSGSTQLKLYMNGNGSAYTGQFCWICSYYIINTL